jgi:prevent-host-death family protein
MKETSEAGNVVPVAELKARLSEFLRRVKAGQSLVVTERGRAIARVTAMEGAAALDERLEALVASGAVRPPSAPLAGDFWRRRKVRDPGGRSLGLLLEERADGR